MFDKYFYGYQVLTFLKLQVSQEKKTFPSSYMV